jgi:hypothetical protein
MEPGTGPNDYRFCQPVNTGVYLAQLSAVSKFTNAQIMTADSSGDFSASGVFLGNVMTTNPEDIRPDKMVLAFDSLTTLAGGKVYYAHPLPPDPPYRGKVIAIGSSLTVRRVTALGTNYSPLMDISCYAHSIAAFFYGASHANTAPIF